jgi:hypothetical protein
MTDANTMPEADPEQIAPQLAARIRRLMLIAGLTTGIGIAAVFIAIGYRLFHSEGSAPVADVTATLPKGAKIIATGVSGDRLILTLEVGGATEIRTFDARTFKPVGRLKFANEP